MTEPTSKVYYPTLSHERSAPYSIDPAYSAMQVTPTPPSNITADSGYWLYGEAELECYRLAVLRKRACDAKLKIYYPGKFHTPSNRALFRLSLSSPPTMRTREFSFRCNGHAVVRAHDRAIYRSETTTEIHKVTLNGEHEGYLEVEITTPTVGTADPAEPPCLWIPTDSLLSSRVWEWSIDGCDWRFTRSFPSLETFAYPHLVEMPTLRLTPKRQICNNLYDFGCELLARVVMKGIGTPTIIVGESIAEAMNDNPEDYEQSTEMVATDEESGTWQKSAHLLAFRYLRVPDDVDIKDIACHAVFYPVQYHGAFAASDDALTQIWSRAAYTLRLCMHDFLVDGIKRDRLPWTGDLAVSLLANAYTFADAEIVRRSLTALGRAGIAESDINGIVDYSLVGDARSMPLVKSF